ncbi:MAG: nucleotidyltransferase domain-containing protein [Nanoarchaeota archaeon]|nr:nucleotidyltransferase domain-containing protein [Nanoarchaeota archaeon]MBU1643530.1 nucleotidyltransferase domain-containing protein [Nanoarchaeota archaeon]MBU1977374.1 nucleotidyltransferase domain-containing protein [Nanoarchaeota archaeon]
MVKRNNEEKGILKYLIDHKEQKFSINQLAKARKVNYKSAYQNILKLRDKKIIETEKLGNTTNCSFNYKFDSLVFAVESERREDKLKDKKINSVFRELKNVENPFFIVLLFGSYASGKQTKGSDIDILIIVNDSTLENEIKRNLSILPFDVHCTYLSTKEFKSMINSREFNVVEEVKKNNIILRGVEGYYQLIENVRH